MSKRRLLMSKTTMIAIVLVAGWTVLADFPLTGQAETLAPEQQPDAPAPDEGFVVRRRAISYPRATAEAGILDNVIVELTFNVDGAIVDSRVLSGPEVVLRQEGLQSTLAGTYQVSSARTLQVIVKFTSFPRQIRGFRGGTAGNLTGVLDGVLESRSPPPPPPPAPDADGRLRVTAGVSSSNLIQQIPPQYPPLARQARIEDLVLLKAVIERDETIQNLRVVTGHPLLSPAAHAVVWQWKYSPTLLNGQPVEVVTTIRVNSSLQPEEPDQ